MAWVGPQIIAGFTPVSYSPSLRPAELMPTTTAPARSGIGDFLSVLTSTAKDIVGIFRPAQPQVIYQSIPNQGAPSGLAAVLHAPDPRATNLSPVNTGNGNVLAGSTTAAPAPQSGSIAPWLPVVLIGALVLLVGITLFRRGK